MKRDGLVEAERRTLKPLPAPHDRHFGVVPAAPPEYAIPLGNRMHRLQAAIAAIAEVDHLASTTDDPFYISRILIRQEAISSSSIEGTHSTLDELLELEEEFVESRSEAEQVRDYALVMEKVIPRARWRKSDIPAARSPNWRIVGNYAANFGRTRVPSELWHCCVTTPSSPLPGLRHCCRYRSRPRAPRSINWWAPEFCANVPDMPATGYSSRRRSSGSSIGRLARLPNSRIEPANA